MWHWNLYQSIWKINRYTLLKKIHEGNYATCIYLTMWPRYSTKALNQCLLLVCVFSVFLLFCYSWLLPEWCVLNFHISSYFTIKSYNILASTAKQHNYSHQNIFFCMYVCHVCMHELLEWNVYYMYRWVIILLNCKTYMFMYC